MKHCGATQKWIDRGISDQNDWTRNLQLGQLKVVEALALSKRVRPAAQYHPRGQAAPAISPAPLKCELWLFHDSTASAQVAGRE